MKERHQSIDVDGKEEEVSRKELSPRKGVHGK
jgi:hypothetical protein